METPDRNVVFTNKPASVSTNGSGALKEAILARLTANVTLPRPPAVVLRVLEKASQPDCSIDELADIVHLDPGLCAKLLQTVNSALFGLRHPVGSIDQALKLLGLRQIRSLSLSLSLPAIYENSTATSELKEYWRYSVSVGIVARELAIALSRPSPIDDLLAGLLCDLGTIVIQQACPDKLAELLRQPPDLLAQQQCELETELLGIDHAEVGAYLLRSWRLPDDLTEPVRFHHVPRLAERKGAHIADRAFVLYFASKIANFQKGVLSSESRKSVIDLAQGRFGMNEEQLVSFLEPLNQKLEELAALLKVEIGPSANFAAMFASAAQELARLSIEASADSCKAKQQTPESALWRLLKTADDVDRGPTNRLRDQFPSSGRKNSKSGLVGNLDAIAGAADAFANCAPMETEIELGQYKVIEVLGRGGMGVVFRAFDNGLKRHVAIKVLGPWLVTSSINRKRFAREAQAAAAISHENVVTVYAVEESGDLSYMVMEFVDGMSLDDRLHVGPPLSLKEIVQVGAQTAEGLAAAHSKNLIHRDVKPANILLTKYDLRVKLTDFGLARPVNDSSLTQEGDVMGTPQFMAPEQVEGEELDCRADLFSLGGVLYMMCTGVPPFGTDHFQKVLRRICLEKPRPIQEANRSISRELITIIEKLLAKQPDDRFQSADEVARLLRRHLFVIS
jgi:HD-like signal output (HDOD) protein